MVKMLSTSALFTVALMAATGGTWADDLSSGGDATSVADTAVADSALAGGTPSDASAEAASQQAVSNAITNVNTAISAVGTSTEKADLCPDKQGFMVPCSVVDMVNQADIGYRAGVEDAMAGKPMGSAPAGGAPTSYIRGYNDGLGMLSGAPTLGSQDAEKAAKAKEAIDAMDPDKRPVFKATFRGLIDYQNAVNNAQSDATATSGEASSSATDTTSGKVAE